ncbi:MAG: hypothetical protein DRP51_06530 [Candidatus Zixiibacteriota bacterium]|nr:MAG: hypothetical protein DRP51_06530 [candidate division Zixibacteria bacterium]
MNKKAFLLGFFSVGGQVLLIRELVAGFSGDELFIGTALFGWLLAVALGSYLGGKKANPLKADFLFISGAILLPVSIIAIRLSSTILNYSIGEIIPFGLATLISILLTFPTGFISGILFSSVSREGYRPAASINRVYLFEGIGAFVGGVAVTALIGPVFSNLSMAVALGIIVILFGLVSLNGRAVYVTAFVSLLMLIAVKYMVPKFDYYFYKIKYHPYNVENSFETYYGHQAIITRDSTVVLLTDNKIEAVHPELETAENILIPPLLYKPDAGNILIIGRTEFGIEHLSTLLPKTKITAIDPRGMLGPAMDRVINSNQNIIRIVDDPTAYISNRDIITKYDIVIVVPGEPDSYKNGRYFSERFLRLTRRMLKPDGILYIPTSYDTDRFISGQKRRLLSTIYSTLGYIYRYVHLWPGTTTLFFVSNASLFEIPYETIINRIDGMDYKPQFISDNYLKDRLDEFKLSNLYNSLDSSAEINNLENPKLIYNQILLNSQLDNTDSVITYFVLDSLYPALFALLVIILLFLFSIRGRRKRKTYGLFLYFTAGLTTLSAELIAFYVYQSSAGSLYSELGLLIGTFMLGLSLGTYIAIKSEAGRLEYPSLLLLLTSMLLYLITYAQIPQSALIYYHLLFLFTTALAGGGLFVSATYRYYFGRAKSNRGTGYAYEITGSAIGALFAMTIILPLIGLQWLIGLIIIFLFIGLVGAYMTE